MLLSEIVKRVNAKSFGETDYDYDDIYPYFQEAIDSLNSQLDVHRRVADAPRMYTEDTEYNFLLDIYINNYIVTYIVVAMDNASLSVTSRTQTYAAQLEQYKTQTISDLYKWMPVKSTGASMAFDLTGYAGTKTLDVPQVKAWYDESIGGKLSGYGSPIPAKGVRWDNPYGTLVVHPKYADYRMKPGSNTVPYVFIPNEYFRQYYKNTIAYVSFYGYNIDFPVRAALNNIYDIGNRAGLNALLLAAWTVLKDDYGKPVVDGPSVVTGSYTDDQGTESVMILQHESGLCFYDIDTGAYYLAAPVDLSATSVEFNKTEIINNSVDLRLQEMQDEIDAHKAQVDIAVAEHKAQVDDIIAENTAYAEATYATKSMLASAKKILEDDLKEGSLVPLKAEQDGEGNNIVDTYARNNYVNSTFTAIANGNFVVGKAQQDSDGNDIGATYAKKSETTDKFGKPNGIATLNENGVIPSSQLPSYVDDVIEGFIRGISFFTKEGIIITVPEAGKIYLDIETNKSYRWSGSSYVEIASSIALGETSATAYAGDKGKKNAEDIAEIKETLPTLQPKLTAGNGISISADGTISISLPNGDEVAY